MKSLFVKIVFLLLFPLCGSAQTPDTTIRGVKIGFTYSPGIFPKSWQPAPTNGQGEQIDNSEISRSKLIVAKAIIKYPSGMLQKNLCCVYFLKSMQFFEVGYGGTNSSNAVYLTNDGINLGYTEDYVEQSFHHEFSSILYRNYLSLLDTNAWKKANIAGFDYNDPEAGVGAIRNNESSQSLDSVLCGKGFLTQYAYSGLENDINTIAQNLFTPEADFWKFADKYPRIKQKTKILIGFYNKIDPVFTESYFRKFSR